MKQKLRRYLYLTLILILTLTAMPASAFADTDSYGVDAEWYNFRNNPENNGITDSATPVTAEETALKWGVKYGTGWVGCTYASAHLERKALHRSRKSDP